MSGRPSARSRASSTGTSPAKKASLSRSTRSSAMTIDSPDGPTLDRPIEISFMGDWGLANLTQVARWLQHTLIDRTGEGSKSAIHWGTGGADGLRAVGRGDVDVAV